MAKRNNVRQATIITRDAAAIGGDIVAALRDKETAGTKADACYKESASILDSIAASWTMIKFNQCKSPESTKAAYTAAGVTDTQGAQIVEFLAPIKAAVTEFNPEAWKTVAQGIRRWSKGYTGSKPLHPDAKAAAPKADKPKAEKAEPTTETPVRDKVHADPQFARVVLGELVAGFSTLKGAIKKNKLSTALVQEVLDLLAETDGAIAALK